MEYTSVADAQSLDGLRLVLTQNVPGPWSEAAKALFRQRGVHYTPVAQVGGGENEELLAWTGHRNAPIALYNNEPPRVRWIEMVELAERLGRGPSLLPEDANQRMLAVGLTNEIAGERGFAWQGRLLMLKPGHDAKGDAILSTPMYRDYYDVRQVEDAVTKIQAFLNTLSAQIKRQRAAGSDYLVGDALSLADIYWAYFSQLLEALPPEQNPMPDFLRKSWGAVSAALGEFDPELIAQRNRTFERHLELPLSF
ncbi:MAG: glutathione binding-like protein [Pseudomonadales bacterium]